MADSDSVRSRRKRAHAAGDHSLCRRCEGGGPLRADAVEPTGPLRADAVRADLGPCMDPAGALARLAGRLEAAHVANPGNALLARELRATLLALPIAADQEVDPLEGLRAVVRAAS
jgi:hypothetical protein